MALLSYDLTAAACQRWLKWNKEIAEWAKSTRWPGEPYQGWVGGTTSVRRWLEEVDRDAS